MKTTSNRIGVIMGGLSAEREISLKTGEGVASALESKGHHVVRLVFGADTVGIDQLIRAAKIDVAFIALHGRGGEDGCIQGLLELMQIPYTGSNVLASALAMDKLKAKELFRLHNVATPPYYVVDASEANDLEALHGSFGFPAIVKPRSEGSSVGLTKAMNLEELQQGVALALAHDDALVERFIKGAELHVGILNGRVLGAIEVVPKSGLYDYESKYTAGHTEYIQPPRLPVARVRGVLNLAERAARALGCTGACRVDVLVTEGENEYVLEVNTLPGMTPTSLLPKIALAAGMDYATLCEEILKTATLSSRLGSSGSGVASQRVAKAPATTGAVPASTKLPRAELARPDLGRTGS
jgi:D-alanine-D-alanine ligase